MIKQTKVIQKALCDACGTKLSTASQRNDDGQAYDAHRASLTNEFGYGSPLDYCDGRIPRTFHLCEECYKKACDALGLPWCESKIDEKGLSLDHRMLMVKDDTPFDVVLNNKGEVYHLPVWRCENCPWEVQTTSYKIPEHVCPNAKRESET